MNQSNEEKTYKPRTVISPAKIARWIHTKCHSQYLESKDKWTAFMTLGGMDINCLADTEQDARLDLINRVLNSPYFLSCVPDEHAK